MNVVGNSIVYCVIALAIVVFSVLSVTSRKILRAATYLLFTLFATAALYFQLGYEFLGAVQLAVYAGGILVLFVFSILLTSKPGDNAERLASKRKKLGLAAAVAGVAVCGYALFAFFSAERAFFSAGRYFSASRPASTLAARIRCAAFLPLSMAR